MAPRAKRIVRYALVGVASLIALTILGALAVAWSGVYNVAASRGHPAWLNWFLTIGMERSVAVHSGDAQAPPLDDTALIALGAGHFQGGCAPCHGAPGQAVNPIFAHMLPSPPKLEAQVGEWKDAELFWIVKHGLQYAGMPAWSGEGRNDEVWAVVAFLRTLPELSADDYAGYARGNAEFSSVAPAELLDRGRAMPHQTACARCHDAPGAPPVSDLVPRLAGQSAQYLREALLQYSSGIRESGIMEPIAAEIGRAEIAAIADYYAGLSSPRAEVLASQTVIERGRRIATLGDPDRGAPPCEACHGAGALAAYPRLAGQSARYAAGQLRLWRKGGRADSPTGALMADIAMRLSPEDIDAVSTYYQSLARSPAVAAPDRGEGE